VSLDRPPRLAEGVELIGAFEGSGFKEPPYLARRADGQVIMLTRLLFLVARACDGVQGHREIAAYVTGRFGRRVSADNVHFLVEQKLRPLGVLSSPDGSTPRLPKLDPLLALRHRVALIPERLTWKLAGLFTWLHHPPIVAAVLAAIVVCDALLLPGDSLAAAFRSVVHDPALLLGLFASITAATAFHEIGHASACRYGGARPGVLGVGVYLVWPAFYCDVTDAYRLGRAGRLRTDLGGIYFNLIFAVAAAASYAVTGVEALLLVIMVQHLIVLQQLIPLLRFDGYYVLTDLTGVPDILGRVRPILGSLLPARQPDQRVRELKPWVRAVVTGYVVALVPALALLFAALVTVAPRMFVYAYESLGLILDRLGGAIADGRLITTALVTLQAVMLILPCAAVTLCVSRLGTRSFAALWRRVQRTPPAAGAASEHGVVSSRDADKDHSRVRSRLCRWRVPS
jgi:putative peptide zinc metalloprotease protein